MGYITTRKARILAKLTKVQAALDAANDSYLELLSTQNQSYGFDSGEGSHRATRKDTQKLLDEIDRLEAKERSLLNDFYNTGLVSVRLRRKKPCLRR